MLWYNELAADVQQRIAGLDWSPLLGTAPIEITSRPKTLDTLTQKLLRDPATPLPSVQDVAGVRFEAEMSLDQQDAVASAIAGMFDQHSDAVKDLRPRPHSGYRAVHVWLRLPARVEVQVRTHLQGAWANAYEAAADVIGRDIRYGFVPDSVPERDVVITLQSLSVTIAQFESTRNAKQRRLLELREQEIADAPLYRRQVEVRLEEEWTAQREAELEFLAQLREVSDQFRSIRREVQ